jgi:galactokinase
MTDRIASTSDYHHAATPEQGVAEAEALFAGVFGGRPDGVWSAPGRVNVIGEHVDYNGGLCLPIALPHRAYVAVRVRPDRRIRLVSPQTRDAVDELDLDAIGPKGSAGEVHGWAAYPAGVAWALEQAGLGRLPGFDAALWSCVPLGSGLSSSAALECSMAVALDDLAGLGLAGTAEQPDERGRGVLVDACRRAENDVAGANTGGLDQSASLRCRTGHALELDCRDMSTAQIPFDLPADGLELLVINTRAPHQLVDGQYAERRATCEEAARLLGVGLLVEVADRDLEETLAVLPADVMRRRVRHVVTEIRRTRHFVAILREGALEGGRLDRAAALLDASHDSLRDDYQVTVPELDTAVDTARELGAHGARMTGGGFGGSAIALVDRAESTRIAAGIAAAFADRGFNAPQFIPTVPGGPAGRDA